MTSLKITPNFEKKTAKFEGTIAGGERVRVEIIDANEYIGGLDSLRLRAVGSQGETLAQFPFEDSEDTWAQEDGKIICELNLNTDKMLEAVPPASRAMVLFVLDDGENEVLYFKSFASVEHWPRKVGEEEPLNLAGYADFVSDVKRAIENAEASIDESAAQAMSASASAKTSAQSAVDAKQAAEDAQRRAELSHAASVAAASHAASIKNEAVNTFKNVEEEVLELKGTATTAIKIAEQVNVKTVLLEKKADEAKTLANQSKELANIAIEEVKDVRVIAESAKASADSASTRVDELSGTCSDVWMKADGAEELAEMANNTANTAKEMADAAYSPDNPPPTPDMKDYAKKSGVVKLYMAEDDPYVGNDLGDLGTTSPRELLAFNATVDVEDDEGNLVRSADNVNGTVGANGFIIEREWVNPNDASSKHGVYSRLDAGRLDIFRTFFDDSYWMDAEESFSVGTDETPDGSLGIVLRFQGVDGSGGGFASAMTTDSIYANAILGSLNNSERGYDGVSHIEFSQYGDIGYSFYNDVFGVDDYMGVNVQEIIQVAYDYSSRYLYNLDGLEFSDGYSEIRFYEYDWESGLKNDRVIYLNDIYNSIYNSSSGGCICFGDNYHSYDDTGTTAAFGLINSIDNSEWACFGTYGMEAGDDESHRYMMVTSDMVSATSYTESGEWWASASIDAYGSVYASVNIQTDGWVDAAQGITIGEAVLNQESLQKLLALIAE